MKSFQKARYYQINIDAANKIIEYLYQDALIWDQLPAYKRHGRLIYFDLFQGFMSSLKIAEECGGLTGYQLREYRLLKRKERDVLGTIRVLKRRDEELNKEEQDGRAKERD